MKLHSRDSYQPRLSGDHSKRRTRGGEGSIREGREGGGVVEDGGTVDRSVRSVWSGRVGSQVSTCVEC